jgi:hypothetical protein
MTRWLLRAAFAALLAWVLTGCEHLQTGQSGIKAGAKVFVRAVYAQVPDAEVDSLPYRGVDVPRTVKRIRDRFSQIRPFLERGVIGIASDGFLRARDAAGFVREERDALERLIRAENNDRLLLYRALSDETGHGEESDWIAYVAETFAAEWIGQAPAGWWYQDQQRRWVQTSAASGANQVPLHEQSQGELARVRHRE